MGPGALLALLTFNYTHHLGPEFAILLCFVAGCMELLFGLLHLGEWYMERKQTQYYYQVLFRFRAN